MANNFESNFTRQLAKIFLEEFESARVLSKNVNTQLLKGRFGPDSGESVDFKRPTDYTSFRNATGDITGFSNDIITGKATGTVRDYFTTTVDYDEADESLKMGDIKELLRPLATRIVTDLELDFATFMGVNTGLMSGTFGTAVSTWDHVAEASALMQSSGVPQDNMWIASVNPYTQTSLASNQRSLGAGGSAGTLISEAHKRAILSDNFAGMRVMSATTLNSFTTDSEADRAGTLDSNPTVTYVGAKDTMTIDLALTGMGVDLEIRAGETLQITGRNRLNLSTRQPIVNNLGAVVVYTGTVTTAVTLDGSGEGTVTVSGASIFEANGQYNTVDSAPVAGDVVTILGAVSTLYQPNLCWHKNAFSIGSVPLKKLQSIDTLMTTEDGLSLRCSKGSDFTTNENKIRFDLRPAYAVLNPFFAGQFWGRA